LSAVILKTSVGSTKSAKDIEHKQNRINTDRYALDLIFITFIISFPVTVRLHYCTRLTSLPYNDGTDRLYHIIIITQRPKMSTIKMPETLFFLCLGKSAMGQQQNTLTCASLPVWPNGPFRSKKCVFHPICHKQSQCGAVSNASTLLFVNINA
jgi:hypothetical protein